MMMTLIILWFCKLCISVVCDEINWFDLIWTLQLIKSKCLPVLLYGLEARPLTKSDLQSLDFVINRFLNEIIHNWNYWNYEVLSRVLCLSLPSVLRAKRVAKLWSSLFLRRGVFRRLRLHSIWKCLQRWLMIVYLWWSLFAKKQCLNIQSTPHNTIAV